MAEAGPRPGAARGRGFRLEAALALAGFLAVRLWVLACDLPELHRIDELYAGSVAQELLAGRAGPLLSLTWDPYAGGSLVVVLLLAPLVAVLGPKMIALKMVALGFSLASFALFLALLERIADRASVRRFALLFVLAAPCAARLSCIAWGNHAESVVPATAAALLLLASLARAEDRRLSLAAGVLAGLALFFSYLALVNVAALAAFLLLGGLAGRIRLPAFLAGCGIGCLPTVAHNLTHRFDGPAMLLPALSSGLSGAPAKLLGLLAFDLRHYLRPEANWPRALEAVPWLVVLLALVHVARRGAHDLRLLALPPAFFVLVYAASSFYVGPASAGWVTYRYLAPITPFLYAAVAVALGALPRVFRLAVLTAVTLPVAVHHAQGLDRASGLWRTTSAASYSAYGWHLHDAAGGDPKKAFEGLARIPEGADRDAALVGLSRAFIASVWNTDHSPAHRRLERVLRAMPEEQGDARVFVERLAGVIRSPAVPPLGAADAEASLKLLSGPRGDQLSPAIEAVLVSLGRGADAARFEAMAGGLDARFRCAVEAARVTLLVRGGGHGEPSGGACQARAWGREWAGLALAAKGEAGLPRSLRRAGPGIREAFALGCRDSLYIRQPDDPVLRAWHARRIGLTLPFTGGSPGAQ